MTVLVGTPVQALANMSMTIHLLTTSPNLRSAGAGQDTSLPVSRTFRSGRKRGSLSHSASLSYACRKGAWYIWADRYQSATCLGSISQRRKCLAASGSGVCLKMPCVTGTRLWKRPLGPLGFSAWSVTLPMSGRSRLAEMRMLIALLVHEIWLVRNALLLAGSSQLMQSSRQASLYSLRT